MANLTQKYRPINFKDVLDQDSIVTVLKNILKNKNYKIPIMFTGLYGGGKTTLARIFARAVLCENLTEEGEPCNQCESCVSFLNDSNLSYSEIDAASNSGVDKIRKLREDAHFKSLGRSDKKVVVIDECHSISSQGNEALLKQLEDNTGSQIYIFCTTAPEKMLSTVRSRCFEFNLKNITSESISSRLKEICSKEKILFEDTSIDIIASQSAPHVRDAIKNLDYLSNLGKITKDNVLDYFKINDKTNFLKIVYNIPHNLRESINLLKVCLTNNSATEVYEGLIQVTLDTIKLNYGINNFINNEQASLAQNILDLYKSNINKFLQEIIERNKYSDKLTLESDIILINSKLKNNFKDLGEEVSLKNYKIIETTSSSDQRIPEKQATTSDVKEDKVESTSESLKDNEANIDNPDPFNCPDLPEDPKNEDNLDNTSKVFKRYKAYPEQLAILMDKGKKSSSIKNDSTVELKQRVKDFKKNLDREEIRNFLENRRKIP